MIDMTVYLRLVLYLDPRPLKNLESRCEGYKGWKLPPRDSNRGEFGL